MTTVSIPAVLSRSYFDDVFVPVYSNGLITERILKTNTVYFYRNLEDNTFHGPCCFHSESVFEEIKLFLCLGMIYMISIKEAGFSFSLDLREAELDDLRDGRFLRYGYPYYVRENEETLDGPFVLNRNTDKELLDRQLASQSIYVVAEKQSFTPLKIQHSA